MKIKFTKAQITLFNQVGTIIKTENGNTYRYLPYWFKETNKEGVFELLTFENLPDELIDHIKDLRKMKTITEENAKTKEDFAALIYNRKHEDFNSFINFTAKMFEKYARVDQKKLLLTFWDWYCGEKDVDSKYTKEEMIEAFLKTNISNINKSRTEQIMVFIGEMGWEEKKELVEKMFSKYCNFCLSERPCYCMRDD